MNRYTEEKNELQTFGFDEHTLELLNRLVSLNNYHEHIRAKNELVELGERILPVMHRLLKSNSIILRKEAVKITMQIADHASIPVAIQMLEDSDGDIRWIAAETLIKMGRVCLRPLLQAIFHNSQSYFLREGAHHVLYELIRKHDAKEFKELQQILLNGELQELIPMKTLWILNNILDK
jgi:HEAT repeat protein